MGNLAKDIKLDTIMPVYRTVKKEVDGEIKEERVIVENVDIEGFSVQGDYAPLSKSLLCVGHSSVRTEKGLWKQYYNYQNPDDYREFWFCYDKLSNKLLIYMQKHSALMFFIAFFGYILCPIIGKASVSFSLGTVSTGIILALLTHRNKIVDVIFVHNKNLVEVLKQQKILRFELLKDIIEVHPWLEDIYDNDGNLIAEDIQVCRTEFTERGNWLIEQNKLLENKIKSLEEHIRQISLYYEFSRETLQKKIETKKMEEINE